MKRLNLSLNNNFRLYEVLRIIRYSIEKDIEICFSSKTNYYDFNNEEIKNVKKEFESILLSEKVVEIFTMLQKLNILEFILPELSNCYGFNQHSKYHNKDVFNHILSATVKVPCKINLRIAALLHDIGKPNCFTLDAKGIGHFYGHEIVSSKLARDFLQRLEYNSKEIDYICNLIENHMKKFKVSSEENIEKLVSMVGKESIEDLLLLQIADDMSKSEKYINLKPLIEMHKKVKEN